MGARGSQECGCHGSHPRQEAEAWIPYAQQAQEADERSQGPRWQNMGREARLRRYSQLSRQMFGSAVSSHSKQSMEAELPCRVLAYNCCRACTVSCVVFVMISMQTKQAQLFMSQCSLNNNWFARQQPRATASILVVHVLGHYILSGATIPSKSSARSIVILNEFTKHSLDFSRFSSPRSNTFNFS